MKKKWFFIGFILLLLMIVIQTPISLILSVTTDYLPNDIEVQEASGSIAYGDTSINYRTVNNQTIQTTLSWYFCPWRSINPLTFCFSSSFEGNLISASISLPQSLTNISLQNIKGKISLTSLFNLNIPYTNFIKNGTFILDLSYINLDILNQILLDWQGIGQLDGLELYPMPDSFRLNTELEFIGIDSSDNGLEAQINQKIGSSATVNPFPAIDIIGQTNPEEAVNIIGTASFSPQREIKSSFIFNAENENSVTYSILLTLARQLNDNEFFYTLSTQY